jgi:CRP/FNR family transcriptional regulator, cyclic AMP receptor protein
VRPSPACTRDAATTTEGKPVPIADLLTLAQAQATAVLSSPTQVVAYVAAALAASFVIGAAFVKTMIPLRWLAVAGNTAFVVYGALHPQYLTLVISAVLLPINIYRARQMMRLTRRVKAAVSASDLSGLWLRPYMQARKLKTGTVLFRKGDLADHLYCLVDGQIELTEIGVMLEPGKIFGEIAFFAPDKRRTHTARCVQPSTVLMVDETTLKQLYYQNPSFGFHLIGLVAGRLSQDVRRIEKRFAGSDGVLPPPH